MIYQLFLNSMLASPDSPAVITSDGTLYTYATAHRLVNAWANYLSRQGVGAADRVAVLLDNEDHHVFIFLALDRINACYVPFDTDVPKRQLIMDVETLDLKKFIIEASLCADFAVNPAICLRLDHEALHAIETAEERDPPCTYVTDGFAKISYIVSSSGSTGRKNLIPLFGAGLVYWSAVENTLLGLNGADKVLATRSPAYDARISEYMRTFGSGAVLYLLTRSQRKDFASILATCQRAAITCLLLIASQLGDKRSEPIITALKTSGLKHLMVTGDACTLYLQDLCERYDLNLWNCYGPTQATLGLSILRVNGLHPTTLTGERFVPIGRPFGSEVRYHIRDGRLCIESPFLSPGYIKQTASEESDFRIITLDGGSTCRVFDTGDLMVEQGEFLLYQGRSSFESHCKIDGVKVTPFVIEQCIQEYNHATGTDSIDVAVVIKKHLEKFKPFAYLIIKSGFDKKTFLAYLASRLQKEEMPILIVVDDLPRLVPSQKIDKKALIDRLDEPSDFFFTSSDMGAKAGAGGSYATDYHRAVTTIWNELFKIDTIAADVEFIFLGGDSLTALEMVRKINERIDEKYSYLTLLSLPKITINSVAESIVLAGYRRDEALIKPLVACVDESKGNVFFLPALLGEGYFSYRHLALRMHSMLDKNIYGLSDPGIADSALLPESMEHAVSRYIRAIRSIQPHGPYCLLGFSFGTTLAYYVAQQLKTEGERIAELHLLDGLPPYLYQALSNESYVVLLHSLANFIVSILNNRFYGEHIPQIATLRSFKKLMKAEQIDLVFAHISKKITNPASINLLKLANKHLSFLLAAAQPSEQSSLWPTLYLTNREQPYLDVINHVSACPKTSADYLYYFWTRYFTNITRRGLILEGEHLTVLHAGPAKPLRTAESFWLKAHDALYNLKVDHFGPDPLYRLEPIDASNYRLSAFFFSKTYAQRFIRDIGCASTVVYADKSVPKYEQKDKIYTSQVHFFACIPAEKVESTKGLMARGRISCLEPKKPFKPREIGLSEAVGAGCIDLVVLWNRSELLTLSFRYQGLTKGIIAAVADELKLLPSEVSAEEGTVVYQYRTVLMGVSTYEAIASVSEFLTEFISAIQPFTAKIYSLDPSEKPM